MQFLQLYLNLLSFVDVQYFSDLNFIQLFRICQLLIEYLIKSQTFILKRESSVIEENAHLRDEVNRLKAQLKEKVGFQYIFVLLLVIVNRMIS